MAQKQKYKLLDGGKSEKSRKKSASGKKRKKSSGKAAGYSYAVATPGEWLRANLGVLIASIAIVCLAAAALVVRRDRGDGFDRSAFLQFALSFVKISE